MKINMYVFLLMCMIPISAFGGIGGKSDNREVIGWIGTRPGYVSVNTKNKWNDYPYNVIVLIEGSWGSMGTGSFVSPRHILTNTHVAKGCGTDGQKPCKIYLSDNTSVKAKVVLFGGNNKRNGADSNDWSILEIMDQDFCKKDYYKYVEKSNIGLGLWRAGFGALRVLDKKDISNIKTAYHKMLVSKGWTDIEDEGVALAMHTPRSGKYDIHGKSGKIQYETFLDEYKRLTNKDFFKDCMSDNLTLKLIEHCGVSYVVEGLGNHNCQSWAGDSGSTIQNSKNQIVLLNSQGYRYVTSSREFVNYGPVVQNIFTGITKSVLKSAETKCGAKPEPKSEPKPEPTPKPKPDPVSEPNEYDIGDACVESHLPPHSTAGHYIKSGLKKYDCKSGACSCAATQCSDSYYLVVNASGNSQGWCYKRSCPSGQHLNIIDGYKTDTKCVAD